MDKETLKYVLAQSSARPLPQAVPRSLELPLDSRKVVALAGIRRCGKTYLLYDTMRRPEARGADPRSMLYLNFEDDRLLPIRPGELDLILRAHEELYPDVAGRKKYLFFDEVQGVPSWEAYVRRLHDTEDVHLFVTGSSSHLLSREIGALEWAAARYPRVPRVLVTHAHSTRKAPSGIQVTEAWRYLLGAADRNATAGARAARISGAREHRSRK